MDDTYLVKKARAGDKPAFAQLYLSRRDTLYRYAFFKLGNEHDAQDAVSACVVSAYTSIASLNSDKAFNSWLFRILYRECCELLRRRIERRGEDSLQHREDLSVTDSHIAPELSEALKILSEEERDIVLLSVVLGYTGKEISAMLGLKHSTVRSKLSRALAKMRSFLE